MNDEFDEALEGSPIKTKEQVAKEQEERKRKIEAAKKSKPVDDEFDYSTEASKVDLSGPSTEQLYQDKVVKELNANPDATSEELDNLNADANANIEAKAKENDAAETKEKRKEELRAAYKDDNAAYLKALKDEGLDVPDRSKGYNVKSIQQAYYEGTIDKSTRDYMMADAIAKFTRNTGRDIGNIGAQFTGGAINNNMETSEWNKRNEALTNNAVTAEKAKQAGTEANINRQKENLELEKANKGLSASRLMGQYKNEALTKAKQLEKDSPGKAAVLRGIAGEFALLETGSLNSIDTEEHVANVLTTIAKAVASGELSEEEGDAWKAELNSYKQAAMPSISIGIDNPLQGKAEETFNPTVEQQADKGIVRNAADAAVRGTSLNQENAKSDVAKSVQNISKMDPKSKEYRNTMKDIFQQAGGAKDKHILFELARNGLIDKELDIPGLTFTSGKNGDYNMIMEKVNEWANDPKFMEEHKQYTMKMGE